MRIAVLGTGMVGQSLAGGLAALGHEVSVGTRDPDATRARRQPGGFGEWSAQHPQVRVLPLAESCLDADLIVNALAGDASLDGVAAAQVEDDTVLLDVANPLDPSHGLPPSLFVANTDSLAERLQRRFPGLRVVNSLNTMTAALMVAPASLGDFTAFVCGNDADAKHLVIDLLTDLGHDDVIDLGGIEAARGTEALMLIWLRLWAALGTPMFSYKIVR